MIVRPPEYLDDVRERELEMQAAEARLHDLNYLLCPHCDYEVEKDFLRCPCVPAQAQGPVRQLPPSAGPGVEALPVLRGGDPRRHRPAPPAPAARAPEPSRPTQQTVVE